jgi:hypothetical protein
MPRLLVHQRLAGGARLIVAVEVPFGVNDTNLEQHPVVGIGAGARIAFAQVEPPLLRLPAIRSEDRFPCECRGARERMVVDQQRIVHAVERDGLADRRVDDLRLAEHRRLVAADVLQPIERPQDGVGRLAGRAHLPRP